MISSLKPCKLTAEFQFKIMTHFHMNTNVGLPLGHACMNKGAFIWYKVLRK